MRAGISGVDSTYATVAARSRNATRASGTTNCLVRSARPNTNRPSATTLVRWTWTGRVQ